MTELKQSVDHLTKAVQELTKYNAELTVKITALNNQVPVDINTTLEKKLDLIISLLEKLFDHPDTEGDVLPEVEAIKPEKFNKNK